MKIKTNQVVGPAMDKDSYVEGSLEIIGDGNFESLEETTMKIKGRGNSTWWICTDAGAGAVVGKCPYQVKFGDKTSVLGMPEDKKWVLLAEKSDKSMIRNKIARYMGELSDLEYTPNAEYIELFINEDYQGTYLIGQKVEESKNRVNIDSPVVSKVSSGALQNTNIAIVSNISQFIDRIKEIGFWVYGTSDDSDVSYWEPSYIESSAIIVGSEGKGMRDLTKSKCDQLLSIPMSGDVTSLNVSVACGLVLYEVLRQRSAN